MTTDQSRLSADIDQFVSLIQAAVILRLRPDWPKGDKTLIAVEQSTRDAAAAILDRLLCPFVPDTTPGGDGQGRSS
jgi:hypothetical protein